MICFYCGYETDENEDTCQVCGVDLSAYKTILYKAELLYNEGLEKANVRDISGAIESLKESLRYNKSETDARNLLGLCYYETGEIVSALGEWVISKNLQPENNLADEYLKKLQDSPGTLQKADSTIRKYNQALSYAREGNLDLAKIQLRRVLSSNPKLVSGHQLLALLCLRDGNIDEARKELNLCNKIDKNNTTTLRYMQEVREVIREKESKKKHKKKEEDVVVFQDGNESIVMPKKSFGGFFDGAVSSVFNLLIGAAFGGLISFFLLFPTYRDYVTRRTNEALITVNTDNMAYTNNIESLKQQVSDLTESLSKYEGKDNVSDSYNNIISAYGKYSAGDLIGAWSDIENVDPKLVEGNALFYYNLIEKSYKEKEAKEKYVEAYNAYRIKDYDKAYPLFSEVLSLDEKCEDGLALYYMADVCANRWLFEEAKDYYEKYTELFPEGRYLSDCEKKIRAMQTFIDAGIDTKEKPYDDNGGNIEGSREEETEGDNEDNEDNEG